MDKGERILGAALEVFGRDGFAAAKVDEIASRAGVAKPTVYHRFGDKETLFTEALRRGAGLAHERVRAVIDAVDVRPADLRAELEVLGHALVGCVSREDGLAVSRLQISEQNRFPELVRDLRIGNRTRTIDALAGKLAQLAATGRLVLRDPSRAAQQFIALVADEVLASSEYGQRALSREEVDGPVRDGVDTFLAAFAAPAPPAGEGQPA